MTRSSASRDCHHVRVRHEHGTTVAYRADKCRCDDCLESHLAERRQRARAEATGNWQPFTSARLVHDHIEHLRTAGLGIDRIAELSGVPGSTVRLVIYGKKGQPLTRLNTATATSLMSTKAAETLVADHRSIDATDTHDQLRQLLEAGLTWPDLAEHLGRTAASIRRSMNRPGITVKNAADIAALHHCLLPDTDIEDRRA